MDILWIVLAILLALIVLFTAAWLFCIAPARPRGNFYKLLRFDYAHRGLHEKDLSVPENSLAAFRSRNTACTRRTSASRFFPKR